MMTMIVYGSLGTNAVQKAERLRLFFGLRYAVEMRDQVGAGVVYDRANWPLLQTARALILVDRLPPRNFHSPKHAISAPHALALVAEGGHPPHRF